MTPTAHPDLRYPIGRLPGSEFISEADRTRMIDEIAAAPARLREAVQGLTQAQLNTPYREGGWTVRQVVHHIPDSHINAYVRFKLALTETDPVIKPYDEAAWALLGDVSATPVETSLALLETLHARWVILLRGIASEDWMRHYIHPEMGNVSLDRVLSIYAWHGKHHVAHITELKKREGW
jgi:hypothetical protein